MRSYTNKTIVLDLDNTLVVSTKEHINNYDFKISFDGNTDTYYIRTRDHCLEFVDFCFKYFKEVIVWSAATLDYVNSIVDNIFKSRKPDRIYSRNDIVHEDGSYTKPLSKILFDITDVYIIDDNIGNFKYNMNNGILIPPFLGGHDNDLLKIQTWFLRDDVISTRAIDLKFDKNIFSRETPSKYLVSSHRLPHLL